jgi:hypothetical protein
MKTQKRRASWKLDTAGIGFASSEVQARNSFSHTAQPIATDYVDAPIRAVSIGEVAP